MLSLIWAHGHDDVTVSFFSCESVCDMWELHLGVGIFVVEGKNLLWEVGQTRVISPPTWRNVLYPATKYMSNYKYKSPCLLWNVHDPGRAWDEKCEILLNETQRQI